jgi:putative alpha-1,2-mannosidase
MGGVSALMSLGLFSLQGTCSQQPVYELTSPVFDEITIKLHPQYYKGAEFTIKTYNNAKENRYIQRTALNGQSFYDFRLPHSKFAEGGVLELWLGAKPNKQWGIEK